MRYSGPGDTAGQKMDQAIGYSGSGQWARGMDQAMG